MTEAVISKCSVNHCRLCFDCMFCFASCKVDCGFEGTATFYTAKNEVLFKECVLYDTKHNFQRCKLHLHDLKAIIVESFL